jgi:predicted Fe-Mo cluster-binding NifX family protein
MKLGITLEDERGLESGVSAHFGQCTHFLIADIENGQLSNAKVVENGAVHGGGGCLAVGEILKYKVTHVIAGGMGMNAQNKFAAAGVKVYGYSGRARDAVNDMLKNNIGGLDACKEHGHDGECN